MAMGIVDGLLSNKAISKEIFGYFDPYETIEDRPSLLAIALSCKSLLDPALDVLWKKRGSLVAVLKLLPGFELEGEHFLLSGLLSQGDWDRFYFYSERVKVFQSRPSSASSDLQIHPSVYGRLLPGDGILFPSLRSAIIAYDHIDPLALPLLWSPTLKKVIIEGSTTQKDLHALGNFVIRLAEEPECLRNLTIEQDLPANYWKPLPRFVNLETVRINQNIISPALVHLQSLQNLTVLHIETREKTFNPANFWLTGLNVLTIGSYSAFALLFLATVNVESLHSLTLKLEEDTQWDVVIPKVSELLPKDGSSKLGYLKVVDRSTTRSILSMSLFSSYRQFPSLTTLDLVGFVSLNFSLEHLELLGESWANLTTLAIKTRRPHPFWVLTSLAKFFPTLEKLTIKIETQDPLSAENLDSLIGHPLRYLSLSSTDPECITPSNLAHIYSLFPNITKIEHSYRANYLSGWDKLNDWLGVLRSTANRAAIRARTDTLLACQEGKDSGREKDGNEANVKMET